MKTYKKYKNGGFTVNEEELTVSVPLLCRIKQNNFAEEESSEDVLAFSILKDCLGEVTANTYYSDFKNDYLNRLDTSWKITSADIEKWHKNKCNSGGIGQALSHLTLSPGEDVPEINA